MGQISAYQDAPYQGVSQAPPQVRRRDQAESLDDYYVALPQGAIKRAPWEHAGVLAGHQGSVNGSFHYIQRSAGDALLTISQEGGVSVPRVYDLASLALQTLTIDAAAQTYINASVTNAQHDLGANTVADFTFVWNRKRLTANDGATNAARPFEALVWIKAGAYAKTYEISVAGTAGNAVATVHTPDGTSAADGTYVDTELLAASLISGTYARAGTNGATVTGNLNILAGVGYTVTQIGPVISITHPTEDFAVKVTDGQGGTATVAAKGKVQHFADLPAKAPDGFTIRIVQQSGTDTDDYYVKFTNTAGADTGVWEECLAPGAQLGLDAATMPMGVVYDAGWKLEVLPWKQRATGNEELVKDPDFIGQTVQDVPFWRGRLGIVSGEGVTLSCSDDPFQLYPRTLALVLDSDPIGRINPASGETVFRYAIPFVGRLVLIGDTIQAEVTAGDVLTPTKASIDTMTQHEVRPFIRPSVVNGRLYLASPRGPTASGITEITIDRFTLAPVGDDLSTAAFRYLPEDIDRVAFCPVNYMACYGASGSSSIFIHLFRYDNQDKVQNGFMKWSLPVGFQLGGMFFVNTKLYVLACIGTEAHLLTIDLSPGTLDPGSPIRTYLDCRLSEASVSSLVYDAAAGHTTISLPYAANASTRVVVRAPGAVGSPTGLLPEIISYGANSVVVAGDLTSVPFYVGHVYRSAWQLTRIYPLDGKGQPLRNGRCNLRRIVLDLTNTGYIRAEVQAGGRPPHISEFQGFNWDDPTSMFDQPPNATTRWAFPVMSENEQTVITLVNDSPFGHEITGFEWTAEFNARSQRT